MKNVHITIKGRVQGVGFRYAAKNMARSLGLNGFVKNMPDHSVYIEIEGKEPSLQDFINWCHKGPQMAHVEQVIVKEGEIQGFSGVETRY